jgi:hypothetical protein
MVYTLSKQTDKNKSPTRLSHTFSLPPIASKPEGRSGREILLYISPVSVLLIDNTRYSSAFKGSEVKIFRCPATVMGFSGAWPFEASHF